MIAGGNTSMLAEATNTFEVSSTPDNGASVKQFNEITIKINSLYGSFMTMADETKLAQTTVTKTGETAVSATGFGEGSYDESTFEMLYPIQFPTQTEAGEYTVSLPEAFSWNQNMTKARMPLCLPKTAR